MTILGRSLQVWDAVVHTLLNKAITHTGEKKCSVTNSKRFCRYIKSLVVVTLLSLI